MVEIMPGILPKVIKRLKAQLNMPIVAGGLIDSVDEVTELISSGASAVSTGKKEFWNI
jgi:glycerol uptake operon antiterminator